VKNTIMTAAVLTLALASIAAAAPDVTQGKAADVQQQVQQAAPKGDVKQQDVKQSSGIQFEPTIRTETIRPLGRRAARKLWRGVPVISLNAPSVEAPAVGGDVAQGKSDVKQVAQVPQK
jgi:hypothetical protein